MGSVTGSTVVHIHQPDHNHENSVEDVPYRLGQAEAGRHHRDNEGSEAQDEQEERYIQVKNRAGG
jgi:hypothetical protein